MLVNTFQQLGLKEEILKAIDEVGYKEPTPVQNDAIPMTLKGRDIHAGAQTGTGKTAAFVLPILQKLSSVDYKDGLPRALIITPTRELATQVMENVLEYGRYLDLTAVVIFGGSSMKLQMNKLVRGPDIIIATPGRLLDHLEQENTELSNIEFFVLDEADRMLDT
ncbi:MAG: DEAD/DEAH box helicase, partial [Lentisphaeraceae bacterium]|nr:DEAD/DEAH box helicase [Lentisphaeraceae bacterium]